jgi:uncharacterized integral membrane protein (TIGR00697 family)
MRERRYFDLILALFVTVLVVSNIASAAKIVDWSSLPGGLPLVFDAGTILFPISYIFGDILTEVYGYRRARRAIWIGFACLALTSGAFALIQRLPAEATWSAYAGQAAYDAILGGISTGGIVLASLTGYWSGSFANAMIMARLKRATRGRALWLRTIGSTLVGEGVDTAVFIAVASALGVFPWSLFVALTVSNYLFKCAVEALLTPATYAIVNGLKRAEGGDSLDEDVSLNPFDFGAPQT